MGIPASLECCAPLDTCEQRLAQEISNVVLLGELPLTPELRTDLANAIRGLVQREGIAEATRILTQRYPCTLAVYLVAHGIYRYHGGTYWSEVVAVMGSNTVRTWGTFFRDFLQQRNLPMFPDLGGHPYITPILIHGGIPDYSLPDFFQHVLAPLSAVVTSADGDMAESLLDTLADLAHRAPADRPIERFLAHGGAVARDFVGRSLELVRHVRTHGTAPNPIEVGLPARVVTHYMRWASAHTTSHTAPTWRPRRPELWFDPWGEGLLIELPAQQLPAEPQPDARWHIEQDGRTRTRKVTACTTGTAWETMPDRLALGPTLRAYTVTFHDGRGGSYPWTIATWHDDLPVIAFDPERGSHLRTPRGLPARPLWLLVRRSESLEVVGGRRLSVLPALSGEWRQHRLEHWDLSQAELVRVGSSAVPILPDEHAFRPQLTGGVLVDVGLPSGELPLYTGHPPHLVIPIPPQRSPEQEARQWRLSLVVGDRPLHTQVSLAAMQHGVQVDNDCLKIDLAQLTPTTFGRFTITLRGPLGRDSTFYFGLVPYLTVEGHDTVRIADATGTLAPGVLRVRVAPAFEVVSSDRTLRVTEEHNGSFTIVAPAETTLARLSVRQRNQRHQELPLTLPLPLLHWSLTGSGGQWRTSPIHVPQAWLDQLEAPDLQVRLEPPLQTTTTPRVELVISDTDGCHAQRLRARGDLRRGWWFPLRECRDTIRSSSHPQFHGRLELTGLLAHAEVLIPPVLRIVQELAITWLCVSLRERGGNWSLRITWNQERHLRGRMLQWWPLWHPWMAPLPLALPDAATEEYQVEVLRSDLPPGRYRVAITIGDRWSSVRQTRPTAQAHGSVDVGVGERAARAHAAVTHDARAALTLLLSAPNPDSLLAAAHALAVAPLAPTTADDFLWTLAVFTEDPARAALLHDPQWDALPFLQTFARRSGVELLLATFQGMERFPPDTWATITRCLATLHPDLTAVADSARLAGIVLAPQLDRITQHAGTTAPARAALLAWLDDQGVLLIEHGHELHHQTYGEASTMVPPIPAALLRDLYGCYLHQIGQIPLLDDDEENRLARLVATGLQAEAQLRTAAHDLRHTALLRQAVAAGSEARTQLITANLRLVVSLIKRYRGRGLDDLDLIQEGNLGLMRAVEKFDVNRGYRFSTYATWWIKQALSRATADQGRLVRLPVHLHEQIRRLFTVQQQLAQQLHREPSETELAGALGMSERKVIELLGFVQDPVSFDMPVGEEEDSRLGDILPDPTSTSFEDDLIAQELQRTTLAALHHLDQRQRQVIELRYGLYDGQERTLEEVGRIFGVTRERIRQIETKGFSRLQQPRISQELRQYVAPDPNPPDQAATPPVVVNHPSVVATPGAAAHPPAPSQPGATQPQWHHPHLSQGLRQPVAPDPTAHALDQVAAVPQVAAQHPSVAVPPGAAAHPPTPPRRGHGRRRKQKATDHHQGVRDKKAKRKKRQQKTQRKNHQQKTRLNKSSRSRETRS